MLLFKDEVKNMEELVDKLSEHKELESINKLKVAVIGFIFDKNGNLILHRRGAGARDEVGMLQALGGSVNNHDVDFRGSLMRELAEECGSSAEFAITDFIGAQHDPKVDGYTREYIDWIILAYKVDLLDGELINNEPDRCVGFEKNPMEEYKEQEVSKVAYNFIKVMLSE